MIPVHSSSFGTGVGITLLIAAFGIVGLPWWSAHRKRRLVASGKCPACAYDISKAPAAVCPECGKAAADLLSRPRWRRTRVLIAILLSAASMNCWWARKRLRIEGSTGWIPSTVLICCTDLQAPAAQFPPAGFVQQLRFAVRIRTDYQELWDWQEHIALKRATHTWTREEMESLVRSRSHWPENVRITFDLGDTGRFEPVIGFRSIMVNRRADADGWFGVSFHSRTSGYITPPEWLILDPMPVGKQGVLFDVSIHEPDGSIVQHTFERPVQIVKSGENVLGAIQSPKVVEIVQYALIAEAPRTRDESDPLLAFSLDTNLLASAIAQSPGVISPEELALAIEVRDGDRAVFRQRAGVSDRWADLSRLAWTDPSLRDALVAVPGDANAMYLKEELLDRLVVHVQGEELPLLANLDVPRFWQGEFTVPIRTLMKTRQR